MNLMEHPEIPGVFLGSPQVREDSRGFFLEIFREDLLSDRFVQANHSFSRAGVLRGLHYHRHQADAWYVIEGEAQAALADLRAPAETPRVATVDLVAKLPQVLYIPAGVAHGFLAVTDVNLIYWVTNYYDATDEHGVAWDDSTLAVPWRIKDPVLSDRDRNNPRLDWGSIKLS